MIERFTERDLPEAIELEKRCFSIPWSEGSLKMLLNEPYCGFALRCEGQLVAYVGMLAVAGEAQVLNLATLPEFRGRGYGRCLLERLFEEAREILSAAGFGSRWIFTKDGFKEVAI